MTPRNLVLSIAVAASALACGVARDLGESGGGAAGCTSCHGDAGRSGSALSRAAPATGAHLAHVDRNAVACGSCHVVPTDASHSDGIVEVTFGGLAKAKGATPSFSGGTCSGVYCHGGQGSTASWTGAALGCGGCHGEPPPAPHAASTACGGCHAGTVRPDGTIDVARGLHANGVVEGPTGGGTHHPQGWSAPAEHGRDAKQALGSCQGCHGVALDGGTVGVSCSACHTGGAAWISNCTFCHGTRSATYAQADLQKAAPPRGTSGETATTERAVGAHQKHLTGGSIGREVGCAECHVLPTDLSHLDGSASVSFGAAARRDGALPVWNGLTCASTYCHGGTLGGGTNAAPAWTGGSGQVACGTCHGLPPPAPHGSSAACAGCHGYDAASFDAARHLNGTVDRVAAASHPAGFAARDRHGFEVNRVGLSACKTCHGAGLTGGLGPSCGSCHSGDGTAWATSCTFCHGSGTQPAPPVDTQGRDAATNVSVGAHASHLGTTLMTTFACSECHPSRTGSNVITDAAHVDGDGVAEVSFGTLARTGSAGATYVRASATSATCFSTYCHGRFAGGANAGQGATMGWTSATQVGCASCHGAPPTTGRHTRHVVEERYACGACHPGYTASTVSAATHVDGSKQVGGDVGWSATTRSCSNSCHGSETW